MKATIEDLRLELWLRQRERGEIVWETRDKRNVPINEMTDRHIENAIGILERREAMEDAYYSFLDENEDAGDRI